MCVFGGRARCGVARQFRSFRTGLHKMNWEPGARVTTVTLKHSDAKTCWLFHDIARSRGTSFGESTFRRPGFRQRPRSCNSVKDLTCHHVIHLDLKIDLNDRWWQISKHLSWPGREVVPPKNSTFKNSRLFSIPGEAVSLSGLSSTAPQYCNC